MSACPRYLSFGLMSQAIGAGIADEVSLVYAEGNYPEEKSEEDRHELFTAGGWDVLPVPGLEGEWDPDKKRFYLVSVGFEGSKTLRLVSREEPDEVSILFPEPGVKPEYAVRTGKRNEPLFRRFRIAADHIIRANAGDAIEAWSNLAQASIENPEDQNVYYVCCGTKSHSLALALRALVLRYPALLYIVPDRHRVVDITPLGIYWRFNIRDMSSLRSAGQLDDVE